jgi:hypothetical protein
VIRHQVGAMAVPMVPFVGAGSVWAYFMRKKPRIVAVVGALWIVCGGAWLSAGVPLGVGLLLMGVMSLVWGGITLSRPRQAHSEIEA